MGYPTRRVRQRGSGEAGWGGGRLEGEGPGEEEEGERIKTGEWKGK